MAMQTNPSASGKGSIEENATSFYKPTIYHSKHLKLKTHRACVMKAWRDWTIILSNLSNFGVIEHGYELPKGKSTSCSTVIRIALDDDDLDILYGRTLHDWIYRLIRRTWNHNWFMIVCVCPWVLYQAFVGYSFWTVVKQLSQLRFDALEEHYHAMPLLIGLAMVGCYFNSYFGWRQHYVTVRVAAQAVEQAVRELWNAEQEKTSQDTVASAPVQTRVSNESCDSAKKMPSIKRVKYTLACKFVTAAFALNVAELHDPDDDTFEVGIPAKVDSKAAEKAEEDDIKPMMYKLLRTRTSSAAPNELRESVDIKPRTIYELFEDKQRGVKIQMPDEEKLIDFSGVILGPEIIEIINALQPSIENEISGVHRHLRRLKHPRTKEDLKMPDQETERRLYLAADTMAAHFERSAEASVAKISHFKPPEKWTQTMKDEMPEKAEQARQADGSITRWKQRVLSGFTKAGELMLPLMKHARLIGNLGPVSNMEDAMSVGPLENLMKECYPHLITKKLSLEECDLAMEDLLRYMTSNGLTPESDDYSAMDSSWTIYDRHRLRRVAEAALGPVRRHLNMVLRNYDHVLDAEERHKMIRWRLRYITVLMDPRDAMLFSGERMTSLFNRWLVLMLEFAEDIRCLGDLEGVRAINATLDGKRRTTIGDGDDNLQGIVAGRYSSQEERVDRFADMYKLLDCCSSPQERTDAEVLSRYHIWCGHQTGYVHVGKLERNMGRLIAFKILRSNLPDDVTQTMLTQKELAMICTDIWQRIMSLQSTMVVRHFARAMFEYAYSKLNDVNAATVYDDDQKRLGHEDGDHRLADCLSDINSVLAHAKTSTWAMVKVSHFKNIKALNSHRIEQLKAEWAEADLIMSMAEIEDKHLLHPVTFVEDFPISSNVAKALGLRKECIESIVAREKRNKPHDADDKHVAPLVQLGAALRSQVGEPADVASLSSTGSAENTRVDPACGPLQFDISGGDPPCERALELGADNEDDLRAAAGLNLQSISDDRGWEPVSSHTIVDVPNSNSEGAGVPSGPDLSIAQARISNVGDKTAGGPKSNNPNVQGLPCSGEAADNVEVVDLELGMGHARPAPGLTLVPADVETQRLDQPKTTPETVTIELSTLLQASPSVTSREPGELGEPRGVGQGLARTNYLGTGVNATERRGNDQSPAEVGGFLEPRPFPKTPTVLSSEQDALGVCQQSYCSVDRTTTSFGESSNMDAGILQKRSEKAVGGSQHSRCSIDSSGSQAHGAKIADKRDRGGAKPNARGSIKSPLHVNGNVQWRAVQRRGTRGRDHKRQPPDSQGPGNKK